jgi:hypothetical protein
MKKTIRCKNTEPYVTREFAGNYKWHVYNKKDGLIVASTYNEMMAQTILAGIEDSSYFQDLYGITESWSEPEPMI